MGDNHAEHTPHRWLEVTGTQEEGKTVHCPRRGQDMPLHECLGCKRYTSLALDPTGKHVLLDCTWDAPPDAPDQGGAGP